MVNYSPPRTLERIHFEGGLLSRRTFRSSASLCRRLLEIRIGEVRRSILRMGRYPVYNRSPIVGMGRTSSRILLGVLVSFL